MRRLADAERIHLLLAALGRAAAQAGRVYLTGGATAVLEGWRPTTIDVDLTFEPEADELLRAIPELKRSLEINVELAAPHHFIPELPGWRERCRFVVQAGRLAIYQYDPYSQALAKIERGHVQDRADVAELLSRGLVEPERLRELFAAIEPQLYRYPAIDPGSFRAALEEALAAGAAGGSSTS